MLFRASALSRARTPQRICFQGKSELHVAGSRSRGQKVRSILVSDSTGQATPNISAIKSEPKNNLLMKREYGEIEIKGKVIEDFSLQT
jgi:hypothetical protein